MLIELVSQDLLAALQSKDPNGPDPVEAVLRRLTPAMKPDRLRRYIAAELTRRELEILRDDFAPKRAADGTTTNGLQINTVWRNGTKSVQLIESCRTIQVTPARGPYEADGHDIVWAVLDTDVAKLHPHFQTNGTILDVLDCTRPGRPQSVTGGKPPGHGSHVCGIIAGERDCSGLAGTPAPLFRGVAPKAKLLVYKVLNDNGQGQDSWIIKALDDIAARNDASPSLASTV